MCQWALRGFVAGIALAPASVQAAHARRFRVLQAFAGGNDGRRPEAGLFEDAAGNLCGTTNHGGLADLGTVFEVAPDGTETVLYSFTGGSEGGEPYGGVVSDSGGNLYGAMITGGNENGLGVEFKLAAGDTESVLHTFAGTSDGAWPEAGAILGAKGNLYGTAYAGGPQGWAGRDPFFAARARQERLDPIPDAERHPGKRRGARFVFHQPLNPLPVRASAKLRVLFCR